MRGDFATTATGPVDLVTQLARLRAGAGVLRAPGVPLRAQPDRDARTTRARCNRSTEAFVVGEAQHRGPFFWPSSRATRSATGPSRLPGAVADDPTRHRPKAFHPGHRRERAGVPVLARPAELRAGGGRAAVSRPGIHAVRRRAALLGRQRAGPRGERRHEPAHRRDDGAGAFRPDPRCRSRPARRWRTSSSPRLRT